MINTNQKPTTDTHKIKRKQTNKLLKKGIDVKEQEKKQNYKGSEKEEASVS